MKYTFSILLSFLALQFISCQNTPKTNAEKAVGGPCECCEAWAHGLPEKLNWETQITPKNEPGTPLEISGTIFHKNGKTPAEGIILYIYHTDEKGEYSRGPDYSTCAKRHGLLRGWMKTGKDGKYKFHTIRPASYPNTTIEQHIHPTIKEPGLQAYWIDEFVFDDDPNLSDRTRNKTNKRGGNGVVVLTKNKEGEWVGKRDIILGENIPGY